MSASKSPLTIGLNRIHKINTLQIYYTYPPGIIIDPIFSPTEKMCVDDSLTVFLGGAGMVGNYNQDMVNALTSVGIKNAVYGNYSTLIEGLDNKIPDLVDMLGDAALLMFYNQASDDPIILQFAKTNGCELESETDLLGVKVRIYKGKTMINEECDKVVARIELSKTSTLSFSLKDLHVDKLPPRFGNFNLFGYSWGGIVAARSALYYAKMGIKISHLVLLGAPINYSLLQAVKNNPNIKSVIVKNLKEYGDPVYAGMTDIEIITAAPTLGSQMLAESGHFYYSGDNKNGSSRRRELVKELYTKGLR